MKQQVAILAIVLSTLFGSSCGSRGPASLDAGEGVTLPPLPGPAAPASPSRQTAETIATQGTAFTQAGGAGNATLGGGVLRLRPGGEDDLAFALYTLDNLTVQRPAGVSFAVLPETLHPGGEDELTSAYWVGFSDYSRFAWEWHGPYTKAETLALNGPELRERYVSGSGSFSYILLVHGLPGGDAVQPAVQVLSASTATADASPNQAVYYSNRPHYARISGVSLGGSSASRVSSALDPSQHVNLSWEHVRDQGAEDNEALAVRVYRHRLGESDRMPIGTVFSEDEIYTDPLDNSESAAPPEPGETYVYYIRAYNEGGWTDFSPRQLVTIPPDPPNGLRASDGEFDDRIQLRWERAYGATGYQVYRDQQTEPLAELGDVETWEDLSAEAGDGAGHLYWVVSVIDTLSSRFGPPDTGFAGLPTPSGWSMFGGNERHSGNLDQVFGPNVNDLMWSFDSGIVFGAPAIASNGVIYFGSADNSVYSVTPDGSENWRFPTPDILLSSPAIGADGTVYVGANNGILYALSPVGELVWTFEDSAGQPLTSPCIAIDGMLYFGSANGRLYKLAPDGSLEWFFDTVADIEGQSNVIASTPAVGENGDVYFGCRNEHLYAVYTASGLKHWRYETGGQIDSSPCLDPAGVIYVGSRDTYLHAVLPNGSNKWAFQTGDGIISSPALNPLTDDVVIGSLDNKVYCIEPVNGTQKWARQAGDDFLGTPAIDAAGSVYIGNKDGRLYAYDSNGLLIWSLKTESVLGVSLGPDGSVYCGTGGHVLRVGPGLGSGP